MNGTKAYVWRQKGNSFSQIPIDSLDAKTGLLSFNQDARIPPLTAGDKYYLRNHPRFIDRQGEWSATPNPDGTFTMSIKLADEADLKQIEIPRDANPVIQVNSEYVTLDGLEVTGGGKNGIEVGKSNHITIQNCLVHNNKGFGVAVREVDDFLIRRSLVCDNGYGVMFNTINRIIVEENEIARNGVDGLVVSWNSNDITIRRNFIHDHVLWGHPDNLQTYREVKDYKLIDNLIQMSGQSLMMEQTYGGELRGNVFVGTDAWMLIFGHSSADDFTIRNNTMALAGYGCINFTGKDYRVTDNIFFTGHGGPAYSVKGVEGYVADRNVYWNSQRAASGVIAASDKGSHRNIDDFKASTGQDQASINADPMFKHAPIASAVLDQKKLPDSTASKLFLRRGSAGLFKVADHVEIDLDGVVRKVVATDAESVTIDPAMPEKPIKPWLVVNWGESQDFKLDLRLKDDSPAAKLAEGGKPAGSTIDIQAYRAGDFDGDGKRDVPTKTTRK